MGLVSQCLKGLFRAVVLLTLTIFVVLPDGRSTASNVVVAESADIFMVSVDDGHEHSNFELKFGHCDDGLDCTVIAAILSQPGLAGAATLEQQLTRPKIHELASLSWPYDAPPPRILS
jgi:hypothetical protein